MKIADIQLGMFVSVTDKYRAVMPKAITWGGGEGKVIRISVSGTGWAEDRETKIPEIEWTNGYKSTMHPVHLQPSTKKAFFIATLQG